MAELMDQFKDLSDKTVATGNWDTEAAAQEALVNFLQKTGLFYIYQQVVGRPLSTCYFKKYQNVRADVLVLPSEKLIAQDCNGGAFIFEVKRPGKKIGPAISQLWDYLNSAWPITGAVAIVPTYAFIFSAPQQFQTVSSILAQNHIGTAEIIDGILHLYCGHQLVMRIGQDGTIEWMGKHNFGKRIGSR